MKMCPKCGCIMKETDEVCPNCGHTDVKNDTTTTSSSKESPLSAPENPFANINLHKRGKKKEGNLLDIPEEEDPFEKKQKNSSPNLDFGIPKVKTPLEDKLINKPSTQDTAPKGKFGLGDAPSKTTNNNTKDDNSKMLMPICMVVIIIIGGIFFITNTISKKETKEPASTPDIKLSENETPKDTKKEDQNNKIDDEENEKPEENPNENDPTEQEEPEEPEELPANTFKATLGNYTFIVSNDYVAVPYEENGLTLTNTVLGTTMTLMEGVYDLKTYRSMQEDLKTSMEQDGTTVQSAYSTFIRNRDLQVMELIEPSVSYIMAITQIDTSGHTLLIMAADINNPHTINYEVLDEALTIIDTIKK